MLDFGSTNFSLHRLFLLQQPFSRLATQPLLGLSLFSLAMTGLFISIVIFSNPSSAYKSDSATNGFYTLTSPLVISATPKITITEGRLRFFDGNLKKNKADLLGGLPFNWTDLFLAKKLSHIELIDAKILIDFRGVKGPIGEKLNADDTSGLLRSTLEKSELEQLKISNSSLKILRDFTKPLQITLKTCQFEVDLDDHEIEGSGELKLSDKVTTFSLSHDFSLKNKKGVVLNEINLSLKNDDFITNLNGVLEGRPGLHFKGKVSLEIDNISRSTLSINQSANEGAVRFMTSGDFTWSENEGTLSDGQFKFGRNKANGSLSLKLSQDNPEVTGTLAFETLNFSEFHTLKRRKKKITSNETKSEETKLEDTSFVRTINLIIPLIRNYDADVRLSADRIKFNDLLVDEAGFSLFQKKGELLIDMAGLNLLGGTGTGLVKIDTNSPKPRWHINSGFKNIDLSKLNTILPSQPVINGTGHLKLKLTSFGDKGEEIYENMFGSLNFKMPKGGEMRLDFKQFIGEQEDNSEQTVKNLKSGTSSFQFLNSFAHFAKGSVIFDHFMVSTKNYDFTGHGFLNLKSRALNWHVASWETTQLLENKELTESSPDGKATLQGSSDEMKTDSKRELTDDFNKVPLLLTCSHLKGFWDALSFEKYTALHLSLLNRACPAFYHYDQLKTKDHPIVHSENAR
jgi:hypothetical protein